MSEKECTKCGEVKALAEYSKCKGGRFGLHAKCKACFSKYMKEWRPRKTKKIYCSIKLQEKECTKCGELKAFSEYYKDNHRDDGCVSSCKHCVIKYRKKNAESLRKRSRKYYAQNREKESLRKKEEREKHPERSKAVGKRYRLKHPKAWRNSHNKRMASDPVYRFIRNLRCGLWHAMNGKQKPKKTMELLGCSRQHLRYHLSAQFTEEMTLENYGEWHIDHIVPVASFDHSDPEQVDICWHYTNMQPLWAEDNIKKSDKILTQ